MRLLSFLLVFSLSFATTSFSRTALAQQKLERWESRLLAKFERKVLPLLNDAEHGCIDCHRSDSMSNLTLSGDALEDLRRLLDSGYLGTEGPDTLLGRVTSENPDRRMPKDADGWDKSQIRRLNRFLNLAKKQQIETGHIADEQFPRSLLSPFVPPNSEPPAPPTQFLTYRQLKSKIVEIFDDEWIRGGRDRFAENLAAFGGADFETRFNESREPGPAYLSALEVLARDVASRAYRHRTGPFHNLAPPEETNASSESAKEAIGALYQRVLYRSPSEQELQSSLDLLRSVQDLKNDVSKRDVELTFDLTVTDPSTGLSESKVIVLPVKGNRTGVRQTVIDQRPPQVSPDRWLERIAVDITHRIAKSAFDIDVDKSHGRASLGRVHVGPGRDARVIVHNLGTRRTVSFSGIDLLDESGTVVLSIAADSSQLEIDGAWTIEKRDGQATLEDGNQHKGMSTIGIPLSLDREGIYEIVLRWHPSASHARNVLVELEGMVEENRLVPSGWTNRVSSGQATFFYDCGNDTIPYVELPGSYRFDSADYIEIANRGTLQRVTAGAIDLINANDPSNNFLIDSKFAKGADQWEKYVGGTFGSYNVRGEKLHDNNRRKGELSLEYRLEDRVDHGWRADEFYKIRVYYPGKRDHEPLVPVTVYAKESSPIIQVDRPLVAKSDVQVVLDASSSFTVQGSSLEFQWRQLNGPRVQIQDWNQPTLVFDAPRQSAVDLGWISVCAALVQHPDFLFTQSQTEQGRVESTAPLMKVAMDLVGRPPTEKEFQRFLGGEPLNTLVDDYLGSEHFRDFYFHRVRLYLESQGTELQDEPVRLWCYVAFNDRPFQEILTADYTVNESLQRTERPAYHGRTGLLTTKGFIAGKPGLPHYNYAAQVSMLFLGYVYEVPPEIVEQREGVTALGTTDPNSTCYSCHKVLTPLAFQRLNWTDDGDFRLKEESGLEIDATDRGAVAEYPFKGNGMEAFALQAVKKERFIRTMINTHVQFYFGRPMRYLKDERALYRRLWDNVHQNDFQIRELIRAIVTSPEYLGHVQQGEAASDESSVSTSDGTGVRS